MMRTNDSLQEIRATLEKIRSEEYPEVSADIINEIIDIQAQNQDSNRRATGRRKTKAAIDNYINQEVKGKAEG